MSAVYLSSVPSASKLDSYTGLPLPDDELGATKSTPLLLEGLGGSSNSPLLDKVLRGKSLRDSVGGASSLEELGDAREGQEEEVLGKTSSFVDILESRDGERDQAWMDMQVLY